jgi:hypothetical protein
MSVVRQVVLCLVIAQLVISCDSTSLSDAKTEPRPNQEEENSAPKYDPFVSDSSVFVFMSRDVSSFGTFRLWATPFNDPTNFRLIAEEPQAIKPTFTNDRDQLIVVFSTDHNELGNSIYSHQNGSLTLEKKLPLLALANLRRPLLAAKRNGAEVFVTTGYGSEYEVSIRDTQAYSLLAGPFAGLSLASLAEDQVLMVRRQDLQNRVVVRSTTTDSVSDLTDTPFWSSSAASGPPTYHWNVDYDPVSQRLAVSVARAQAAEELGIYVVSLGGDVEAHFSNEEFIRGDVSWGPRGWLIYVRQELPSTDYSIWALNVKNGEEHQLLSNSDLPPGQTLSAIVDF